MRWATETLQESWSGGEGGMSQPVSADTASATARHWLGWSPRRPTPSSWPRTRRAPLFTSVQRAIAGRTEILGEPVVVDDLVPAFRDYYTLHGDLLSMPSVGTTSLLYANTDLLEAAGVSQLPQTWDDVVAVCEQIARHRPGPEYPITWSNHGTFFQQAVATQGGLLVDNDNGRSGRATTTNLASKEMLTWVEWWRQLHRDGHYLYTGSIPDWACNFTGH